jgi:hypothetical protein
MIDNSGLLGHAETSMFDKHFTEMLRAQMFKDMMLGDAGLDGKADTAIYTGNMYFDGAPGSNYTVVALDAQGNVVANPHAGFFALKITDTRSAADFLDANGQPLLDANGIPLANEGTDLLIGVETLKFANQAMSVAALFDRAPTLDLHSAFTTITAAATDAFSGSGNAYARGTGFTGAWTEANDPFSAGTVRSADNTGQIHYQATNITDGVLQINGGATGNGTSSNGAQIYRTVELSGLTTANVSFNVLESGLSNNETVRVYLTDNGNAPSITATPIYTIGANTNAAGLVSFTATGNFSATSRLYFVASAMNSITDVVTIDSVSVTFGQSVDADPGNNYTVSYTEQQDNPPAVASTPLINDPDDTNVFSAKLVITDAVAGDRLNVGTLPAGIVATGNGTGAGGLTGATMITLNGLALRSVYETALSNVTFSNPGDNPTSADRHINVTVNDGLRDSAVATTTVHVTPVDDAPTSLGADSIVTNIGFANGNPINSTPTITVAEWMLIANDVDVDGVVLNSAITNVVGLSNLAHSGGSVSFRDGNGAGGSFSYGSGAVSGQVSVTQQTSGTLTGTLDSGQILIDNGSNHTITGRAGNDIIGGGRGNDIISGGAGADTFVWKANAASAISNTGADGRDNIDGGTDGATAGDTLLIIGSSASETFYVYTRADWVALGGTGNGGHTANGATQFIITRGGTTNASIIADLRNVEHVTIDTGDGTDTVTFSSNFDGTLLNWF